MKSFYEKLMESENKYQTIEERTPLKDGYIRLYHNTKYENFQKIMKDGLDPNKNRQSSEGSITWLTTEKGTGYGGYTVFVDLPSDQVNKFKVNSTEYTIPFKIEPEQIKVSDIPIVENYRTDDIIRQINKYGIDKVRNLYYDGTWYLHPDGTGENWNLYIEPLLREEN